MERAVKRRNEGDCSSAASMASTPPDCPTKKPRVSPSQLTLNPAVVEKLRKLSKTIKLAKKINSDDFSAPLDKPENVNGIKTINTTQGAATDDGWSNVSHYSNSLFNDLQVSVGDIQNESPTDEHSKGDENEGEDKSFTLSFEEEDDEEQYPNKDEKLCGELSQAKTQDDEKKGQTSPACKLDKGKTGKSVYDTPEFTKMLQEMINDRMLSVEQLLLDGSITLGIDKKISNLETFNIKLEKKAVKLKDDLEKALKKLRAYEDGKPQLVSRGVQVGLIMASKQTNEPTASSSSRTSYKVIPQNLVTSSASYHREQPVTVQPELNFPVLKQLPSLQRAPCTSTITTIHQPRPPTSTSAHVLPKAVSALPIKQPHCSSNPSAKTVDTSLESKLNGVSSQPLQVVQQNLFSSSSQLLPSSYQQPTLQRPPPTILQHSYTSTNRQPYVNALRNPSPGPNKVPSAIPQNLQSCASSTSVQISHVTPQSGTPQYPPPPLLHQRPISQHTQAGSSYLLPSPGQLVYTPSTANIVAQTSTTPVLIRPLPANLHDQPSTAIRASPVTVAVQSQHNLNNQITRTSGAINVPRVQVQQRLPPPPYNIVPAVHPSTVRPCTPSQQSPPTLSQNFPPPPSQVKDLTSSSARSEQATLPTQQQHNVGASASKFVNEQPSKIPSPLTTKQAVSNPKAPANSAMPLSSEAQKTPPKPLVSISNVTNGIVLSWNMKADISYAKVDMYQLFAYQVTGVQTTSPAMWKKIGVVKALPLPMACTLTQFLRGCTYHFAVRAVDVNGRAGPFSDPCTITLPEKT